MIQHKPTNLLKTIKAWDIWEESFQLFAELVDVSLRREPVISLFPVEFNSFQSAKRAHSFSTLT